MLNDKQHVMELFPSAHGGQYFESLSNVFLGERPFGIFLYLLFWVVGGCCCIRSWQIVVLWLWLTTFIILLLCSITCWSVWQLDIDERFFSNMLNNSILGAPICWLKDLGLFILKSQASVAVKYQLMYPHPLRLLHILKI